MSNAEKLKALQTTLEKLDKEADPEIGELRKALQRTQKQLQQVKYLCLSQ